MSFSTKITMLEDPARFCEILIGLRRGGGAGGGSARLPGMCAPVAGVCTRYGGGSAGLPGHVCTRSGGLHPIRGRIGPKTAIWPPFQVQTPIPGAEIGASRPQEPPVRVQTPIRVQRSGTGDVRTLTCPHLSAPSAQFAPTPEPRPCRTVGSDQFTVNRSLPACPRVPGRCAQGPSQTRTAGISPVELPSCSTGIAGARTGLAVQASGALNSRRQPRRAMALS